MARAVGLDIGSRTIKVVELSGSPKAFKVSRVITRPIPEPDPNPPEGELPQDADELISDEIREIFQTLKLPKDDVCVAFDSGVTIFREIVVPFLEDDQIRKVVKFEAEHHLHSQTIEDVIVNWVKTGESRDGSRLTIFASPKSALARLLGIVRGAGIEPSAVDLDATALFTAYECAGVLAENPNSILVDVGARSSTLILLVDGRPVVLRSFLLGVDQVGAQVGRELGMSASEGMQRARLTTGPHPDDLLVAASTLDPVREEAEKSLGQIEEDTAADMRSTFVRKLHREAMRSLASLQEDAAPERILLSGGGSLLPGLSEALSEQFQLPVERIDMSRFVEWKDQGADPDFTQASTAPAVGCGLRILGQNPLDVELLKEEFAPTNRFDVIKGALATFVTLLFVLLLGLAFVASEKNRAEQRRFSYVAGRAASLLRIADIRYRTKVLNQTEQEATDKVDQWLKTRPNDPGKIKAYYKLLEKRFKRLESELGLGDIPKVRSALRVWLELYRALSKLPRPQYGGWLRILKLDISERSATVRIEVDNQAAFDRIREQFEKSTYFQDRARNPGRIVELRASSERQGRPRREFEFRFKEEE
jgi:type IV pilus assembly protein PilM